MNVSDSEIITSILLNHGFFLSEKIETTDIVLLNACSIREKAELSLTRKLEQLKFLKKKNKILFGITGCFSKKLKEFFLKEKKVDFFVEPDFYKKIPNIIQYISNDKIIPPSFFSKNRKETYEDIIPFSDNKKKITKFLSITRGCNNMCTFCIVPFTRGREKSSNPYSIIKECKRLYKIGYKEITLLGQNVDSYQYIIKNKSIKKDMMVKFSDLLSLLATEVPFMRIRFSTSNPHDMSESVLNVISKYPNICKHIHLPVQSGSNKILKLMNRKYSREKYINLIEKIRNIIPECSISHDIMTGFCGENEKDHQDTISLMNEIKYNYGYMFSYSPRPGTFSYKKLKDDVPKHIKKERLKEIIDLQREHSLFRMKEFIGKTQEILIEGISKRNNKNWYGRNTQNIIVVFPKKNFLSIGDTINVKILNNTSATLIGEID
ncbi:tRNA (N6-isopentenyl adenosine(37)-C2)-methylthiotransferase MiaB [Blattabacterium cuenoti]|uniref:tRNA (N6-isopentenyl adenosine(37)-C2)-methylthiotransferase MiaB n=1 Tax=Blattabacterium cuenoti TaxID=1653831 RepID=UPI001EEB8064|nr:tRNA (N6-isopentenyl adenosine(37)-C2)-methylthiotransferase MiaB [Blattabacterium cuenoti]